MAKKSKAGGRITGRVRPLAPSKTGVLAQFPETVRRLEKCLDLSDDERAAALVQ